MMILAGLLLLNAVLHGVIVGRFGLKGNEPPLGFGVVYAALAVSAFLAWSAAPIAVLVVTTLGLIGLGVNFRKIQHETTVEKIIFGVGAACIACAAWVLLQ